MNEFDIIREFFDWGNGDGVAVGIGDDAAVLNPSPGCQLLTSVDAIIEGVHFLPSMDPADLGFHLAAANLSDMAAMAATPRWALLSIARVEADPHWLRGFAAGLQESLEAHGVSLIGGDTSRATQCSLNLVVFGEAPTGAALLRSGANVGDGIYVTGCPGDSAAGLELAMRGERGGRLYDAFARPTSRVEFALKQRGVASAAIDISDGLFADLKKLLSASHKGAELHIDRLPLSEDILKYVSRDEAIAFSLAGGEDYELLFTSPTPPVEHPGTRVTLIGHVTDGRELRCFDSGTPVDYDHKGYLHF